MIYNKFHFQFGKFNLVEKSTSIDWNGRDSINLKDEFMIFELVLRDKKIEFDINFDISASCDWEDCGNGYDEPFYSEQSNIDIDVIIKGIQSEEDIDLDLKDKETYKILKKLVLSKINS